MPADTVLIVDDNAFVLNTIAASLLHAGFEVLTARSPAEALQVAASCAGPIHLVLTDVILPDLPGPELARQLAQLHPETRSLFITGLPDTPLVAEQILSRGLAFLPKPFLPRVLVEKVRDVLARPSGRSMGASA